jgi:hypothetical protein
MLEMFIGRYWERPLLDVAAMVTVTVTLDQK